MTLGKTHFCPRVLFRCTHIGDETTVINQQIIWVWASKSHLTDAPALSVRDHPGLSVVPAGRCGCLKLWVKMILKNSRNNCERSCDLGKQAANTYSSQPGGLRRAKKLLFKLASLIVQPSSALHWHRCSADESPSSDLQLVIFIFFSIQCWCTNKSLSSWGGKLTACDPDPQNLDFDTLSKYCP